MQHRTDFPSAPGPIGVFDSGYGGLTVWRWMRDLMPQYDYIYLGDNARAPYGNRSFELVYEFTLQAVHRLFQMGCHLVILACNTASAKALRTIQQCDLPQMDPSRRVLGVIRPTAECIGDVTQTRHVGVVATAGTIKSLTYEMEIAKLFPDIVLLARDPQIDSIILGCTHYPLLLDKIRHYTPQEVRLLSQGEYVARSLENYLQRHPEMLSRISCHASRRFYTTEQPDSFNENATMFLGEPVSAEHIVL